MISKLHYITQDLEHFSHEAQAQRACACGIDWLQLRVKEQNYEGWFKIAKEVRAITSKYGVKLILNDSVQIALEINADGVHLGKDDMPVRSARKLLGKEKIIGGTANTLEDIIQLQADGADYIGLGPYRFTDTKQNLSPVLGMAGYRDIITQLKNTATNIPVIAIGGIKAADVRPLLKTGVYGVAVSSSINKAPVPEVALKEFMELLKSGKKI